MNAQVQEKIAEWLEETFSSIGEFCEINLEVDADSLAHHRAPWPAETLEAGTRVGAVQQVRGGEPPEPFGFVFDRGFAIFLACRLLMLLPSAIEEKMLATEGEIEEDDIEGIAELGNLVTGQLNQLASARMDHAYQIEFIGLHAPNHPPKSEAPFPDQLHAFDVKVHAEKHTFGATFLVSDAVLNNWFEHELHGAPATEEDVAQPASAPSSAPPSVPQEAPLAPVNVGGRHPWLVIDRVLGDANQLARLLIEQGMGACTTSSTEEAINIMKDQIVEGLFIDVGMDDESGFAFLKRLRHNFLTDDLPIVITSAAVTREQVMEAVRGGATHIVVKPVTADILDATLKKAINRHPRFRNACKRALEASSDDTEDAPARAA